MEHVNVYIFFYFFRSALVNLPANQAVILMHRSQNPNSNQNGSVRTEQTRKDVNDMSCLCEI